MLLGGLAPAASAFPEPQDPFRYVAMHDVYVNDPAPVYVAAGLASGGSSTSNAHCHARFAAAETRLADFGAHNGTRAYGFAYAIESPCGTYADSCRGTLAEGVISGTCMLGGRFTVRDLAIREERRTGASLVSYRFHVAGALPTGGAVTDAQLALNPPRGGYSFTGLVAGAGEDVDVPPSIDAPCDWIRFIVDADLRLVINCN